MKCTTKTTRTFLVSLFAASAFLLTQTATAENTNGPSQAVSQSLVARHSLPAAPFQISPISIPTREERAIKRWKMSLIPLAASQTIDISSSWGMRELNPVLAGKDGSFDLQAAVVKLGVMGAFVGVEYLVVRKHPSAARAFEKINWSGAALTSGFAVHNYMIK
jgi:hypothetical protein